MSESSTSLCCQRGIWALYFIKSKLAAHLESQSLGEDMLEKNANLSMASLGLYYDYHSNHFYLFSEALY